MQLIAKSGESIVATYELSDGNEVTLGKATQADCRITGEPYLSRIHVRLLRTGDRLTVERCKAAKNPVLFKGKNADRFQMSPGDFFVIGRTTFHVAPAPAHGDRADPTATQWAGAPPDHQFTLGSDELRARTDSGDRLRLLNLMELPEILRTRPRRDFYVYACGLLRMATGAAWVRVLTGESEAQTILAEDAGLDHDAPKPMSRALLGAAIKEAPKPVAYRWSRSFADSLAATAHEGIDWAVCCAMPVPGEAPVLLYLAGTTDTAGTPFELDAGGRPETFLRDTARLVGLVADMIGRAMSLQKVESWQSRLGRFFSAKLVSKILEAEGTDELAPKLIEATVMFFDIRGFSKLTEENRERIPAHVDDLRRVLTAMTQCVYDSEGVVLKYMGDGFLSCWNVPYAADRHVALACRAALAMVEQMKAVAPKWTCGIGVGVGEVVAGSLGSEQIYAYDILGTVVNQTGRVEGITKTVRVPILVTEEVAERIDTTTALTRRVARFRPVGMEQVLNLYTIERIPDDTQQLAALKKRLAIHAEGLEAFEAGEWEKAYDVLHQIDLDDPAAKYVSKLAGRDRPRNFDGVVELTGK